MNKVKVGVIGGAGYTGGELIRILLNHPGAELTFVHSASNGGNPFHQVHKDLIGETEKTFTDRFDDREIDVLFLCSGHGQSKLFLEEHKVRGDVKIIDLSQDFRLHDPDHLRPFTYGLVEAEYEAIKKAENIANPGCFATCIQLGLVPLGKAGKLNAEIHVSAMTGSTGAGQRPTATSHFSWRNNNISVYKAFTHQHLLEINQSIREWQADFCQEINFVPFRGNFTRGILASIYLDTDLSASELTDLYKGYYEPHPFVHISDEHIDLKQVVNTNKGLLHIEKHGSKAFILSAIDNLVKGASGQAVQNMNLMCGLDETAGLNLKPVAF
ncbi:MAG: N-acetyl-gamma-glutamyl-phosphate reductase [Cytophagales bacterium]|nr:N-acetyl-gamma-glutamyl-phosphate reductase [Cytophagales bacterium]